MGDGGELSRFGHVIICAVSRHTMTAKSAGRRKAAAGFSSFLTMSGLEEMKSQGRRYCLIAGLKPAA